MAKHNEIGKIGEKVAANYLIRKNFTILDLNYRKSWGEIDIVAQNKDKIYFIEVKTVSFDSIKGSESLNSYKPEDNMHPWKLKRLHRAIQTYLLSKFKEKEPDWQLDLICVFLDTKNRAGKIRYIENIV